MSKFTRINRHHLRRWKNFFMVLFSAGFLLAGFVTIWIFTLDLPDFTAFEERVSLNSTKIYDRTGEVLLYDTNKDIRRVEIQSEQMGETIKEAFVSIEDDKFYEHNGVRFSSIVRALLANIKNSSNSQGGSTITQQVIKNTLLNKEKTYIRKIKEVILAIKLEKALTKDEILTIYLNDAPFSGTIYGIQEASQVYFNKDPLELTLAESAYLASIPNAPTKYSPYGKNKDLLDARKNTVLENMQTFGYITEEEKIAAKEEVVEFKPQESKSIKAPHFVFYILDYLVSKYGEESLSTNGYKVVTTLDWELQEKAEEIVKKHAFENKEKWGAENQALVSIDPKTGQILTMVGSRDYFDDEIDGAYNIATALRQPGSAFKPFIYGAAFAKGYNPDTVLFDVPTEFNSSCYPGEQKETCYSPNNYDGLFKGPISLRNALAQSRNIPAVKLLYLVGVSDAIKVARDMGISTLIDADRYGLTLVLGGGEVSLLDMVSAYGVFANNGVKMDTTAILLIEDSKGEPMEQYAGHAAQILDKNVALMVSDVLSDNVARAPLFGSRSFLYFGDIGVAGKTGTTNSNKDAWLMGYTPNIVVGVWSGNNDNTSMKKGSTISGPAWREYMDLAIKKYPLESFEEPFYIHENNYDVKPVLRGIWLGSETYVIDSSSGGLATEYTPDETKVERVIPNVHSILYWINKEDPNGPIPDDKNDSQFKNWEIGVQEWWSKNKYSYQYDTITKPPTHEDNIHTKESIPEIEFSNDNDNMLFTETISVGFDVDAKYQISKVELFVDGDFIGSDSTSPYVIQFDQNGVISKNETHEFTATVYDIYYNRNSVVKSITFN